MNEYLTLTRVEHGIVRPFLEKHIKFEFWGLCLEELKQCSFFGNKDEEAHEHLFRVGDNIDLFHAPGVS